MKHDAGWRRERDNHQSNRKFVDSSPIKDEDLSQPEGRLYENSMNLLDSGHLLIVSFVHLFSVRKYPTITQPCTGCWSMTPPNLTVRRSYSM